MSALSNCPPGWVYGERLGCLNPNAFKGISGGNGVKPNASSLLINPNAAGQGDEPSQVNVGLDLRIDLKNNAITGRYKDYTIYVKRRKRPRMFEVVVGSEAGLNDNLRITDGGVVRPEDLQGHYDPNDRVNIADAINYIVGNFETLHSDALIKHAASIIKRTGIEQVPRPPTDYEEITDDMVKALLANYNVKRFIINGGSVFSSGVELGLFCYDYGSGAYYDCEDELKSFIIKRAQEDGLLRKRTGVRVVNEVLARVKALTSSRLVLGGRHLIAIGGRAFDWDAFVKSGDVEGALIEPNPDLVIFHRIKHDIRGAISRLRALRAGIEAYLPPRNIIEVVGLFRQLAPTAYRVFTDWVKAPGDADDVVAAKVGLLLQLIGYTLYPFDYPFNKAFMLIGGGSNGKSTFLNLLNEILGDVNVSHVSLMELDPSVNRFALADMYGKLANISAEPQLSGKFDPSRFKQITGEDYVRVERKFKDAFSARIYAKQIFAANELPKVKEDTKAFWDRWIVIEFPNSFQRSMSSREFVRRYLMPEVSEIILMALYAFRIALLSGGFVSIGSDPKEEWVRRSNPAYAVIKDMVRDGFIAFGRDHKVVKDDLYQLYVEYIKEFEDEDIKPAEKRVFTQVLNQNFSVSTARLRLNGGRVFVYLGVGLTAKGFQWLKPKFNVKTPNTWIIGGGSGLR